MMFSLRIPVLLFFCSAGYADAEQIYLDQNLQSSCLSGYNVNSRSCSTGIDKAYNNLSEGLASLNPGDNLILREGTYGQLAIVNSGTPNKPITIKNFQNEISKVVGINNPAISITGLSDIIIDGMHFENVLGFGKIYDSTRITIRNNIFNIATASGTTGGLKLVRTTQSKITGNEFRNASDAIVLQDASDKNIIATNTFIKASHSLLSIRCSNRNIIRDNLFDNPDQKAVEIYDCEGTSDAPIRYDATKYNIFEYNRFVGTKSYGLNHKYNAIQHGGQFTIVRHNVFTNNLGGGIYYQYYANESQFVYENKMYNNTFYANSCSAIIGDSTTDTNKYHDNLVVNNLLYLNTACDQITILQTDIPNQTTVKLTNNIITDSNPGFINASSQDFRLSQSSPYVDAGIFITQTTNAGSGTALPVRDVNFFTDGLGITGENGDTIKLEGSTSTVRIISIDYNNNILILDQSLAWGTNQGVHLEYNGNQPEPGAFEIEAAALSPPASTTLQIN